MLVEIDKKNTFFKIVYGMTTYANNNKYYGKTEQVNYCYTWVPKDSYLYKGVIDEIIIFSVEWMKISWGTGRKWRSADAVMMSIHSLVFSRVIIDRQLELYNASGIVW